MIHTGDRCNISALCLTAFIGVMLNAVSWGQEKPPADMPQPSEQARKYLAYTAELRKTTDSVLQVKISNFDDDTTSLVKGMAVKDLPQKYLKDGKELLFTWEYKPYDLARLEADIKDAKKRKKKTVANPAKYQSAFMPIPVLTEFDVGNFGTIGDRQCKVARIIDGENMLVELGRGETQELWMKGLATKNLADGKYIEPKGVFEVTGTKRIDGETRTYYVLERFDIAEAVKFMPKPEIPDEEPKNAKPTTKPPKEITIPKGKAKLDK